MILLHDGLLKHYEVNFVLLIKLLLIKNCWVRFVSSTSRLIFRILLASGVRFWNMCLGTDLTERRYVTLTFKLYCRLESKFY